MASDDRRGGSATPPRRRPDVRTRIAVGAVGAAAVLGVGAYTITSHLTAKDSTETRDTGALAPIVSVAPSVATSVAPPVTSSVAPSASSAQAFADSVPSAVASSPSLSPKVKKEIDEARAKAAKDGHRLQRALVPKNGALPPSEVHTRTEQTPSGTLRITTAKADLTGRNDQLLAADDGHRVGDAKCTQKFHFANAGAVRVIPNLLLCWRTSSERSVVTLAVGKRARPAAASSVAVIDREWSKLD